MEKDLIEYLKTFIKTDRFERMEDVLKRRTEYLTVVFEDLHYSQNASAVIRHCDAFGIQKVHVIENRNKFKLKNHAMRGTLKWITLKTYNEEKENSLTAIEDLRSRGYRIIATSPREGSYTPSDFDLEKGKSALFFGNERDGLSQTVMDNADAFLHIPMEGFVESLNISASCAIILQNLVVRLRNSTIDWHLEEDSRSEILLQWMKGSIKKIDKILKAKETI
jgi:tRNA (guanosine-2'-O-)-methyltransferase